MSETEIQKSENRYAEKFKEKHLRKHKDARLTAKSPNNKVGQFTWMKA